MAVKGFVIICASALFIQSVVSQCMGSYGGYRSGFVDELPLHGIAYGSAWPGRVGCGGVAPAVDITIASSLNAAYGGCLPITSNSATAPTGLAVTSENAYESPVAVGGNLPFLGTAAMEGVFSSGGAGAIDYGCGDGVVAITAEEPLGAVIAPAAIASASISPAAINPAMAPWGYNGIPSSGCSSSYIY